MKSLKTDNSKLAKTLQETLDLNEQLRSQVEILEGTVTKRQKESDKQSSKM